MGHGHLLAGGHEIIYVRLLAEKNSHCLSQAICNGMR